MKKSLIIAISLVAVFFFASTNQVMAQWSFDTNWTDTQCSCGVIVSKDLQWKIIKVSDDSEFASGSLDITLLSPVQIISGNEVPEEDELYKICIKVYYYDDASVVSLCCDGDKCDPTDSAGLLDGSVTVTAPMN